MRRRLAVLSIVKHEPPKRGHEPTSYETAHKTHRVPMGLRIDGQGLHECVGSEADECGEAREQEGIADPRVDGVREVCCGRSGCFAAHSSGDDSLVQGALSVLDHAARKEPTGAAVGAGRGDVPRPWCHPGPAARAARREVTLVDNDEGQRSEAPRFALAVLSNAAANAHGDERGQSGRPRKGAQRVCRSHEHHPHEGRKTRHEDRCPEDYRKNELKSTIGLGRRKRHQACRIVMLQLRHGCHRAPKLVGDRDPREAEGTLRMCVA